MEEKNLILSEGYGMVEKIPIAVIAISICVSLPILNEFGGFRSIMDLEVLACLSPILAIIVISINVYFYMKNCKLVVTNKRVYGKATFGKRVDLPIDSVSAVGTSILWGIDIGTSSGKIHFKLIKNKDEIHSVISKLLIERQQEKSSENIETTSNADELRKYKDLLDSGVITQAEFDKKKKQLLDL